MIGQKALWYDAFNNLGMALERMGKYTERTNLKNAVLRCSSPEQVWQQIEQYRAFWNVPRTEVYGVEVER